MQIGQRLPVGPLLHQRIPLGRDRARAQGLPARQAGGLGGIGRGAGAQRRQLVQGRIQRRAAVQALVAQQRHIAACLQRGLRRLGVAQGPAAKLARRRHAQVIADDGAAKAQPIAQNAAQPARRKAGRALIHPGVNHMRGHHRRQRQAQGGVGRGVICQQGGQRALIARQIGVRISLGVPVAGKVLAAATHARQQQPVQQRARQLGDDLRARVQGAIANHRAAAPVHIQHGREGQINAAGAQLGRQHIAASRGRAQRPQRPALGRIPQAAQAAHGRQAGKAPLAQALHAPALVIDGNQRIRPRRPYVCGERAHLRAALPVAAKQDDPRRQRMRQPAAVIVSQGMGGDVDHQTGQHGQAVQKGKRAIVAGQGGARDG